MVPDKEKTAGKKQTHTPVPVPRGPCPRCDKTDHFAKDCQYINATCHFCQKLGHLESVCRQKKMAKRLAARTHDRRKIPVQVIQSVKCIPGQDPVIQQLQLNGKSYGFEVDSFPLSPVWSSLRKHSRQKVAQIGKIEAGENPR